MVEHLMTVAVKMQRIIREWAVRLALLLAGLCIAHLGVTLFLLSNLGSDPFNVLIQGLYRTVSWPSWVGMTHGRTHLAVSLLIMAVLLFADRTQVRLGTVVCMALGGPIIDVCTLLLAPLFGDSLPMAARLIMLVAGCAILAFGMTVVIRSEAGTGPNDLVAVVISKKLKKPFGAVRVLVDLCFAGAGFTLGGVLGLGTVICAFLVGPIAQVFMPVSGRICIHFLRKAGRLASKEEIQ